MSRVLADRWGVTEAEVGRSYPCDDLVPRPWLSAWRGVSVDAPAGAVWPWLTQLRVAPYSYDWLDNLGRTSPREPLGLAEPRVGDEVHALAGRVVGRVATVYPGSGLTLQIGSRVYMSYVLVPSDVARGSRLLLKVVNHRLASALPTSLVAPVVSVGDWVMVRRQLLNLALLAETHPQPGTHP